MRRKHSVHRSRKLLILCLKQFGQHIDTYMYCKFLCKTREITYVGFDNGMDRQIIDGINVVYVSRKGNIAIRYLRYLITVIKFMWHNQEDICFIKYFTGCALLKLCFPKRKFIFDIRSGSVDNNIFKRCSYDLLMRLEATCFRNVTIVSNGLAQKLYLSHKASILPLGSLPMALGEKDFDQFNLLYVGTLSNRDIEKTIYGFHRFLSDFDSRNETGNCTYTVIGDGYNGEADKLRELVKELGLTDRIEIKGWMPFESLRIYFEKSNVGVSFVPLRPYFEVQPVTKTFDYLLSGMIVIATDTMENRRVINSENGVLIKDRVESFADGLSRLFCKRRKFSSAIIKKRSEPYNWKNIVRDFEGYLQRLDV